MQALFFVTDDDEQAAKIKGGDMGPRSIAGSVEHIIDQLGQYAEMGFDEVIIPDFTLGATQEERAAAYEMFNAEIVPQLS